MKNSKSIRLSSSTSMQAIAAHARRAAAVTAVERRLEEPRAPKQPKQPKKSSKLTPIEMSTRSLTASLAASAGDGVTLVNESPGRYSSAYAIISLYRDADVEAHNLALQLHKADPTVKVPKLSPRIKYVLFASPIDSSRLGSVAIYCQNAYIVHATISRTGRLLGLPIKSATLEVGISQYIDVELRS